MSQDENVIENRRQFLTKVAPIDPFWALEENYAAAAVLDFNAGVPFAFFDMSSEDTELKYSVTDGVAELVLEGPMTKKPHCAQSYFGGVSYIAAAQAVIRAGRDPMVKSLAVDWDSPGGQVNGVTLLVKAFEKTNAIKPIYSHINGSMCSAACWSGSMAEQVIIDDTGTGGSIGTYMAIPDYTKAYAERGIKVVLIKSGPYKGAGYPGTSLNADQIAKLQTQIDAITDLFISGVSVGRGVSIEEASKWATGETWIGQQAVDVGIADSVMSYDDMVEMMKSVGPDGLRKKLNGKLGPRTFVVRPSGGSSMAGEANEEKIGLVARMLTGIFGGGGSEPAATPGGMATDPNNAALASALGTQLITAGITSAEGVAGLIARAKMGDEFKTELIAYATKQATRRYATQAEPDKGVKIAKSLYAMDVSEIKATCEAWETEADAKFGFGKDGMPATRESAAPAVAAPPAEALNAENNEVGDDDKDVVRLLAMSTTGQNALKNRSGNGSGNGKGSH